LLESLRSKGYKKVSLAVQKANYAVSMYKKAGFRTAGENDGLSKNNWGLMKNEI